MKPQSPTTHDSNSSSKVQRSTQTHPLDSSLVQGRVTRPTSNDWIRADQAQLLVLGEQALNQLDLQARVAKIEAERVELRLALEQARNGQPMALQSWLNQHGQSVSAVQPPHVEVRDAGNLQDAWETWLPAARQRLQARLSRMVAPPHFRSMTHESSPGQAGLTDCADADELGSCQLDEAALSRANESEHISTDGAEQGPAQLDSFDQRPVELVEGLELSATTTASKHAPTKKGRWRGMVISTVFHLALLVVLAATTLDSPVKDGLLALVAGDGAESAELEEFELADQMSTPETNSPEISEPVPEQNLSEVLPDFESNLAESLGQTLASQVQQASNKPNVLAAKSSSAKKALSFYGAESTGNSFCFLIDGSGSMKGDPWEAVQMELLRSLNAMKPTQRFQIVFFAGKQIEFVSEVETKGNTQPMLATPENIKQAKTWLASRALDSGGKLLDALEAALKTDCDCLYFLTDGDLGGAKGPEAVLNKLQQLNRSYDILDGEVVLTPIHIIAFYSDKKLEFLSQIARENRGQFAYIPKPSNKSRSSR